MELVVTKSGASNGQVAVELTDIAWKSMRCTVAVDGQFTGVSVDIRREAGDPSTTLVLSVKPVKENGTASVMVEDDAQLGQEAYIALLGPSGELVSTAITVIGGGKKHG